MNRIYLASILIIFLLSISCSDKKKTDYVDPFIGTGGHGHTFPGATLPFGMVQLSPDTRLTGWDGCSGYHYSDSIIYGFSHTHLSGTGVSDYCDILFMPTTGDAEFVSGYINENNKTTDGYGSRFMKEKEFASPGFYSVFLEDYKIQADLTASLRCGVHKYIFPENLESNIIIDLTHRDEVLSSSIEIVNNKTIQGSRISRSWAKEQHIYFYAVSSKDFHEYGISVNNTLQEGINFAEGMNIKSFIRFNTKEKEEIIIKVGISSVSIEGAKMNYEAEVLNKNFDEIKNEAEKIWEKELDKIEVEGGTEVQKKIFYTALYHSFIAPNLFQDVDGSYRGTDLKIHKSVDHANYTIFSLWDTYRATHPLYTIIQQERTNDFIRTFLKQYEHGGQLPVWELAGNYTECMIGYHSVPVIVDAYLKGINDYDVDIAYEAMKHSANLDKLGLKEYKEFCYIPANFEHESVSKNLEYAYDDWCIAQFAKQIGNENDYVYYISRAQYYKNLFEPESGFMIGKRGACWMKPFDPAEVNFNFTEANSWQYSFCVPHDITGLANLMGGEVQLQEKLDQLFSVSEKTTGRGQVDITGLIGQYAHGNEPSHHMAYLYNFTGSPWKSQKMISRICSEMYSDKPDGLIGNEDCGQMSSWYVFSAMGFYPVTPGSDQYIIGSPVFDKATIHLENGREFVIKADNVNKENHYIKSSELNGDLYTKSFITHKDIIQGGVLNFVMSEKPNKAWGTGEENIPVRSINDNLITAAPFVNSENTVFENTLKVELGSVDSESKIYYTVDGSNANLESNLYTSPFIINESATVKFIAVNDKTGFSKQMITDFTKIPKGRSIQLFTEYAPQYSAGGKKALIDGIKGINDFRLGDWQGYQEVNLEVVVDLGKPTHVENLSIRFLQDINAWIFMPSEVEFFVSDNNRSFIFTGRVKNDVAQDNWDVLIKDFRIGVYPKTTRYIKIIGKNIGKCPEGHKAEGYNAWIFADEITIK